MTLVAPEHVGLVAVELHVVLGLLEARGADELEQAALGLGTGEPGFELNCSLQCGGPSVVGVASELRIEGIL